ncbi:BA14K family protein [Aureimonas sp. AU12]|uniref:BA14K family protein n=1 Tax=Aureimonas sp. AU12 TaxID=1638161 RepID=UPI0007820DC3|nr:BA14K family protein [Aureimonas sp. AU12]
MTPHPSVLLTAALLALSAPAEARDFLADGGGIQSRTIVRTPYGRVAVEAPSISGFAFDDHTRSFLRDGGSIRSERPRPIVRESHGGRFERISGSVSRMRAGPVEAFDRDTLTYGTSGPVSSPSVIYIGTPPNEGPDALADQPGVRREGGAKIIDVASARLDRRPYGKDGLDIVYSGATKIIRVSPDFRRAATAEAQKDDVALAPPANATRFSRLTPAEQAMTVYPDDGAAGDDALLQAPAPTSPPIPADRPQASVAAPVDASPAANEATPSAEPTGFEPWTPEWLRDCVARYPGFDASLGTYTDESGRRRFCTGEP